MSFKPVILIYDLDNRLVDEIAAQIGATGLYTSINTYNEANALDAVRQYDRCFGLLTNKLSCIITGWNNYKKPRDQFLYLLRDIERRSPLRQRTPVVMVTEDHREDLKRRALEPAEGGVCAYLHTDSFREALVPTLQRIVFDKQAEDLNRDALRVFLAQSQQD